MSMPGTEYKPWESAEEAIEHYKKLIEENADFLLQHKLTAFDEVDSKRFEAKQCASLGLGISAINMICIALEECIKCLLKYNKAGDVIATSSSPNLETLATAGTEAETTYGGYNLHNSIQKARKEGLITQDEEQHLLKIKDDLRNPSIHSHKSKLFDILSKFPVTHVDFSGNTPEVVETQELNPIEMILAHGFAEKRNADASCQEIYKEIDDIIMSVSLRFWRNYKSKYDKDDNRRMK